MAVLDLTRCPICHARDSLARQTTQLESRTHVTYECRACGTLLAWLGDEMWLEADRWSFQKVGRPEQADLLYRSMTVAELRKLAGEKPPAAPVGVGKDARPAKPPPIWIDIPPARVEPPPDAAVPPAEIEPRVVEAATVAKAEAPSPVVPIKLEEPVEAPSVVEVALPVAIEPPAAKTDAPRLVEEPPAGEVAPPAEIEPPLEVAPMVTPRPRAQERRGKQRDRRAAVGQAGRSGAGTGRRRSRGSPFLVLSVAAVLLCLICSAATMIIYSLVGNWPLQGVPPTDPPAVEALATDTPVPTNTPIPTDTPAPTDTAVPTETAVPADAAAPPETAGAPGGADGVEFQGVTDYLSGSGSHYLVGEVLNRTADTLHFVEISATFYDASGQVVGGGSTFTELNSVEAGSAAPFKLTTLNPPAFERYDLQVDYATTTQPPIRLEVVGHSGSLGVDGWYRVVGEVRNPHDFAAKFPEIVVTYYNGAHQVIRVEANLAEVNPLEPGQSSPFEVVLTDPPADLQHYALQAEAVQQ
jgi:hypothetical protein